MNPQITVYRRHRVTEDDPMKFQADILLRSGENHHGIGKSSAEALLNAAMHWKAHEQETT